MWPLTIIFSLNKDTEELLHSFVNGLLITFMFHFKGPRAHRSCVLKYAVHQGSTSMAPLQAEQQIKHISAPDVPTFRTATLLNFGIILLACNFVQYAF